MFDGLVSDGNPRITQQFGESRRRQRLKFQVLSPGVGDTPCLCFADAENGSLEGGFGDSGNGTAVQVPGSGVENQKAAVCVLPYIRHVEIDVGRSEEILIVGAKGGPVAVEDVALHAVRIELGAEEVPLVFGTEAPAAIEGQS